MLQDGAGPSRRGGAAVSSAPSGRADVLRGRGGDRGSPVVTWPGGPGSAAGVKGACPEEEFLLMVHHSV